jgi:beta-galactosidase
VFLSAFGGLVAGFSAEIRELLFLYQSRMKFQPYYSYSCLFSLVAAMHSPVTDVQPKAERETGPFKTDPTDVRERKHVAWYDVNVSTGVGTAWPFPATGTARTNMRATPEKHGTDTTFNTPGIQKETCRLLFEAVYNDSKVWLNGISLVPTKHRLSPFEYEVSQWIRFDKPNTPLFAAESVFVAVAILGTGAE